MNKHFQAFKEAISWFNNKNEPIEIFEIHNFKLTREFKEIFPLTSSLISSSHKTGVAFKGKSMILFTWEIGHEISGWLCQFDDPEIVLIDEHQILIENIGGIVESFNGPGPSEINGVDFNYSLTLNQNFLFVGSLCTDRLDWANYYLERCQDINVKPIDLSNCIFFTQEANGAKYFYDSETKEVKLFSHDHNFHFVEFLPNQPEYTMHKVKGINTFQEFVELIARQWIEYLARKRKTTADI